jgi:thiol-disulfide isomerase/thioredoxin
MTAHRHALIVTLLIALATLALKAAPDRTTARNQGASRLEQLTLACSSLDVRDLNGRRWRAAELDGRVVLLDFWATWCAPCLADVPWLRQARGRFPADRLAIIGVSLDVGDRRSLTAWLNRNRVDWPQTWDARGYNGVLARRFGVISLPQSLLVDGHGRVVATNLRGERLLSAIARLVAGTDVER